MRPKSNTPRKAPRARILVRRDCCRACVGVDRLGTRLILRESEAWTASAQPMDAMTDRRIRIYMSDPSIHAPTRSDAQGPQPVRIRRGPHRRPTSQTVRGLCEAEGGPTLTSRCCFCLCADDVRRGHSGKAAPAALTPSVCVRVHVRSGRLSYTHESSHAPQTAMVRKSSRTKGKKSKPASSAGAPSLNDRGRYQPQHKKATATGPSSAKAAKKSKKSADAIRCVVAQ